MGNFNKSVFKPVLAFQLRPLLVSQEIIKVQQQLLAKIRAIVPEEIACHIQHCVHSGEQLLIYTESASWASQIRFYNRVILNKFAEIGQQNFSSLQVRIIPPQQEAVRSTAAYLPTAENIKLLRSQLNNDANQDELSAALSRLAETLEKRIKA